VETFDSSPLPIVTEPPIVTDTHAAVRYLATVSEALAEPGSYVQLLERVSNLVVPAAADWCTIDLIDPVGGGAFRVAAAHIQAERLRALEAWAPRRPPTGHGAEHGINMSDDPESEDLATSYMVVALESRGHAIGALTLGALDQRYHDIDVMLATELGRRIGAALDDARAHDEPANRVELGALRDLMDLTAIETNRLGLVRADVDCAGLVAEVLDVAELVAARRAIRLTRRCELHGAWLDGDRERLAQAVANLVGHALTVCTGEVVVRGVVTGGVVQIAVADDGPGLSGDELAHLYDGRTARTGLAIARGIVLAHGGSISVSCTPGEGSTFVIALPLRR
jgi:signal transduction histidine kinase